MCAAIIPACRPGGDFQYTLQTDLAAQAGLDEAIAKESEIRLALERPKFHMRLDPRRKQNAQLGRGCDQLAT